MGSSGEEEWSSSVPPPIISPTLMVDLVERSQEQYWSRHFDKSVNAVSFGFVATAILVSMFLVMAIFERFFITPTTSSTSSSSSSTTTTTTTTSSVDIESSHVQLFHSNFHYPSPKMTVYANGVSVLMPGEDIPTFLAYPTPQSCPPEPIMKPFEVMT